MAYSDFDVEFSSRTQADANLAGSSMAGSPTGVPYQNAALADPLSSTGDYCRAIQHNDVSQSDPSVGQVKMLLANTGSVSAQAFYGVGHDQLVSLRLRVRMGRVDGDPDAADSADNLLTMVGVTAFTSGSAAVYSGGYELVLQAKGSGASRAVSISLRASQPVDFSSGVSSLLGARTVLCSGTYALDAWHYLRLDMVPVSSTQKSLVAYVSSDDGVNWSQIGSMTVLASDPEWSALTPNRAGIISLRCGEAAATELYNHFVDGFESRIAPQQANVSPAVSTGFTAQNAPAGQLFTYTFPETAFADADGDNLTYTASLADGSVLPAWLSFDGATRTFSGTPADEDIASLTVAVTASDPSGAFSISSFALDVADATAPVITGDAAVSIAENTTAVGTYASEAGVLWSLSGDDAPLFAIADGVLSFIAAPDYEDPQDFNANGVYEVTVEATDAAGNVGSLAVSVTVTDANEAPTSLALSNDSVDEGQAGALVGLLSATDPDADDTIVYTVQTNTDKFDVENGNELVTKVALVYTEASSHAVTVRATDFFGDYIEETFTISVNDVDDVAPTITATSGGASVSVVENTTAVDSYTADEAVTWSLSGTDAALFSIDASGNLSFAAAPDYEAPGDADQDNVYAVTVVATDAAGNSGQLAVTVTVTDVIDSIVMDQLKVYLDAATYTSGTTWTDSQGLANATLDADTGTPTHSTDNGGYFAFDGSDGMTIPSVAQATDFDNTDNYTIETWLYISSISTGTTYILEKWANSIAAPYPYVFRINTAGTQLYFGAFRDQDGNDSALATAVTGQWLHCVGVYDWANSLLKFYVNGQLAQSVALTIQGSVSNTSTLYVGKNINGAGRLNGRIAAIRTYHKALSSTEVSQNFNFEKNRFGL